MACKVETPDLSMLLDPGCALGPRKGAEIPHPLEYRRLHDATEKIVEHARDCTHLFISHYHHDHFKPRLADECYVHSPAGVIERLYAGKHLFLKSRKGHIGKNQSRRAKYFKHSVSRLAGMMEEVDFKRIVIGNTTLDFSFPVPHGEPGTRMGWVTCLKVKHGDQCIAFAPDVQGPIAPQTMDYLTREPIDLLLAGGPPLYLGNVGPALRNIAVDNLARLHETIPTVIVDHHCCRSQVEFEELLASVGSRASPARGNKLVNAAGYMGIAPAYLESSRLRLYEEMPPSEEFLAWAATPRQEREKVAPPLGG